MASLFIFAKFTTPIMRKKKEVFIMFREIRRSEYITEEDRKRLEEEDRRNREFLKIKPESDITTDECVAFVNSLFQKEES